MTSSEDVDPSSILGLPARFADSGLQRQVPPAKLVPFIANIVRTWFSASRFDVPVPVGAPPALFIPLYAEELRKKVVSLLGAGGYQISLEKRATDKYAIVVLRGALSGVEVVVEMKKSLSGQSSQANVSVDASSKTERALVKVFGVLLLLVAIPTFIVLLFLVRLILALLCTVIAMIPLLICAGLVNAALMSVLYKIYGNEFDSDRRTAMAAALKQVSLPDPLSAFRQAAKASSASPPVTPKGL